MCGRLAQKSSRKKLAAQFDCVLPESEATPHYNLSPGQDVAIVRLNPADGQCYLNDLRWGLVPSWSKDAGVGMKLTNARAETIAEKPSFAEAFQKRRCLIPADAFYEWQRTAQVKQPYAFARCDGEPLAMAGLWEGWRAPDGTILRTFAVVTTVAKGVMLPIHDRMPVLLDKANGARWLRAESADRMDDFLNVMDADILESWPVSSRVNSGRENGPELLQRAEPAAPLLAI